MPVNRGLAIDELLAACRRFPLPDAPADHLRVRAARRRERQRRRTRGGSPRCSARLRAKVNLIPFNDWADSGYRASAAPADPGLPAVLLEPGSPPPCAGARARTSGPRAASSRTRCRRDGARHAGGAGQRPTAGPPWPSRPSAAGSTRYEWPGDGRPRGGARVPGRCRPGPGRLHVMNTCTVTARADLLRPPGHPADRARASRRAAGGDGVPGPGQPRGGGAYPRGGPRTGQSGEVIGWPSCWRPKKRAPPAGQVADMAPSARTRHPPRHLRAHRPVPRLRQGAGRLPAPVRLLHRAGRARGEPEPGPGGRASSRSGAGRGRLPRGHADRGGPRPLRLGPRPARAWPGLVRAARGGARAPLAAPLLGPARLLHARADRDDRVAREWWPRTFTSRSRAGATACSG